MSNWVKKFIIDGDEYLPKDSGSVRFDEDMSLTEEQKAVARENIGAGTGSGSGGDDIFWGEYGVTSVSDIDDAIDEDKEIIIVYQPLTNDTYYLRLSYKYKITNSWYKYYFSSEYCEDISGTYTGKIISTTLEVHSGVETWSDIIYSIPSASNATPLMDNEASPGNTINYARGNHVHPKDTSKADINSPSFTGTPTAPTPATGDDSTKIATTEFVHNTIEDTIGDIENIENNIANIETSSTASKAYSVGEYFWYNNTLYCCTVDITSGGTITPNTNCVAAKLGGDVSDLNSTINDFIENTSRNVMVLTPHTETKNGVTITVTEDSITLSGTASANAYFYDFFNNSDFVGSYTFGLKVISGTGAFLVQIPYNTNITNNKKSTFVSAPTAQIVVSKDVVINTTFRLWAVEGSDYIDYEPSVINTFKTEMFSDNSIYGSAIKEETLPLSALTDAIINPGSSVMHIPDVPETVYHTTTTWSIKDNVITINGTLASGLSIPLPSFDYSGYYAFNFEVISGSYTGTLIAQMPIATAWITTLSRTTSRMEYFDGTQKTFQLYATKNSVFSNFKLRVFVTEGLLFKPYSERHGVFPSQTVQGLLASDYNVCDYSRMGDDVLYNVFGTKFAACKNGMIGRVDESNIAKFAILADLHYNGSEAFYKRIYNVIKEKEVDFCIMLGDIIDSGYYSSASLYATQIGQYKNSIKVINCPNFPFSGNHDDDVREFARHGVIDFGNIRIIYFWADYMTTAENPGGHTGDVKDSELTWLETQLQESTAVYNILACHYPISTDEGFTTYFVDADTVDTIEELAETYNVKLYLNGHQHDHNVSTGTAGEMTDINLPNGGYAYGIATIDTTGVFTLVIYSSTDDTVLKTITVNLA